MHFFECDMCSVVDFVLYELEVGFIGLFQNVFVQTLVQNANPDQLDNLKGIFEITKSPQS